MPQYFFDLRDGDAYYKDLDGMELAGIADAQREATKCLADMAEDLGAREPKASGHPMCVEVRDLNGPVFVLVFGFAKKADQGSNASKSSH
jgi:hypothetical protein